MRLSTSGETSEVDRKPSVDFTDSNFSTRDNTPLLGWMPLEAAQGAFSGGTLAAERRPKEASTQLIDLVRAQLLELDRGSDGEAAQTQTKAPVLPLPPGLEFMQPQATPPPSKSRGPVALTQFAATDWQTEAAIQERVRCYELELRRACKAQAVAFPPPQSTILEEVKKEAAEEAGGGPQAAAEEEASAGLVADDSSGGNEDDVSPPPPPDMSWPSKGAIGHPHNCCKRGCKYAQRNRCKDGPMCKRCHLCPWRRAQEKQGPGCAIQEEA